MYLIDNTYFKNKLQIDGVLESNTDVSQRLTSYNDIYVVEFLQKLLGAVDFEDLNSNIEDGALPNTAPQKWLDFVNGTTYTKDGKDFVWRGLLYQNGNVKRSILANYVFCKIVADLETNNGRFTLDTKNAVKNVMRSHYLEVWNELVSEFIENNCAKAPLLYYHNGVPVVDYYSNSIGDGYVNLATYLKDHEEDFQNVNLSGYNVKNRFDLV